jgi:hypothetical protein
VASAINLQVIRDLSPAWNVQATVAAFPDDTQALANGFVPVYVVPDTGGYDGVHRHPASGKLFALVRYSPGLRWSLPASHEILELLVDPTLNYTLPGPLLHQPNVTVHYLVEICDPCEGSDYAYQVDAAHGIYVSDFCLPSYYGNRASSGGKFTMQDNIAEPGAIAPGGRVTWKDSTGRYSQRTSIGGPERVVGSLSDEDLFGAAEQRSNVRGAVDRHGFGLKRRGGLRPLAPAPAPVSARRRKQRAAAASEMEGHLRELLGERPARRRGRGQSRRSDARR